MIAIKYLTLIVQTGKVFLGFLTIYLSIIDSFIISYQNSKQKVLSPSLSSTFNLSMNASFDGLSLIFRNAAILTANYSYILCVKFLDRHCYYLQMGRSIPSIRHLLEIVDKRKKI
jgi:hypothetical protein